MHAKLEVSGRFATELATIVVAERARLKMRQDELAVAAGVSTRVIHQIENGKATSRLDSLIPVLDVLGLTVEVKRVGGAPLGTRGTFH